MADDWLDPPPDSPEQAVVRQIRDGNLRPLKAYFDRTGCFPSEAFGALFESIEEGLFDDGPKRAERRRRKEYKQDWLLDRDIKIGSWIAIRMDLAARGQRANIFHAAEKEFGESPATLKRCYDAVRNDLRDPEIADVAHSSYVHELRALCAELQVDFSEFERLRKAGKKMGLTF